MNNIIIELCKEDRARLDILNKALAMLTGQLEGINAALEAKGIIETVVTQEVISTTDTTEPWDTRDLHQEAAEETQLPGHAKPHEMLAKKAAEAPQEVVEEQAPPTPETVQDEPQEGKDDELAPTVTKQDIQQKVIELVGKGKKAEVRDIITTYADNVSGLPDSTLNEVWARLTALEG